MVAYEQNLGKVDARGPASSDSNSKKSESNPWKISLPAVNITINYVESQTVMHYVQNYDLFRLAGSNLYCESSLFKNKKELSVVCPNNDTFVRLLSFHSTIKYLSFVGFGLLDVLENFSRYANMLMERCPNLVSIELLATGSPIDEYIDPKLLQSFFTYENLQKMTLRVQNNKNDFLVIDYNPEMGICAKLIYFDDSIYLAEVNLFEKFPPMKMIKLHNINFMNEKHILSLINKSKDSLETLEISCFENLGSLLESIYKCPNLQSLDLGGMFFKEPAKPAVVKNIVQLQNLRELSFDSLEVPNYEELVTVFSNVNCWKHLTKLTFDFCEVIDDTVLFAVAMGCKKLEIVRISSNDAITDFGLMKLMLLCSRLKELSITTLSAVKGYFLMHLLTLKKRKIEITISNCSELTSPYIKSISKDVNVTDIFTE